MLCELNNAICFPSDSVQNVNPIEPNTKQFTVYLDSTNHFHIRLSKI